MRLFSGLFKGGRKPERREPNPEPTSAPAAERLNPKVTGNFLVHQLLLSPDSKYGLPASEIAGFGASLPGPIKELFPVWADFFLAWLLRRMAGATYGREFQIEMMAHAFARLENSRDIVPDMDVPIDTMRNFFARLDDALTFYDQPNPSNIDREAVPVHILISMSLLLWSEGTPYFKNARPLDGVENDLAFALAHLDDIARPLLAAALKTTAESSEPF